MVKAILLLLAAAIVIAMITNGSEIIAVATVFHMAGLL